MRNALVARVFVLMKCLDAARVPAGVLRSNRFGSELIFLCQMVWHASEKERLELDGDPGTAHLARARFFRIA